MIMDINYLLKDEKGNSFIDMNNHSDWIRFFFIFSRFEYALKRSRYVYPKRIGNKEYAEADWKKYCKDVQCVFNKRKHEHRDLAEAVKYLENNPPKTQVMKDGKLEWALINNNRDHESLIHAVKQVRNNLFHGGKYPSGPVLDPSRDNELIRHSITVLKYLLCSSPEVKKQYFKPLEKEQKS